MDEQSKSEDFSDFLQVAEQAATQAGAFLLTRLGQVDVFEKNPGDFVTQADIESQRIIHDLVVQHFPDHQFLGEEEIESDFADESDFRWIVDPIDGTTNFIHQLPSFSVSIAIQHKGTIIAGCVYDPLLNEMFSASKGNGATLNGEPIQTSNSKSSRQSIVVCSLPSQLDRDSKDLNRLINVLCDSEATVRRLGSAALNLCYVACGRVDGYWSTLAKIWDIAAGIVILSEAKGVMTKIDGSKMDFEDLGFVAAATDSLNDELVSHLNI